LRVVSVERGYDPREFVLIAFGGAGPLHAAEMAKELGIRRIIVPGHPGLLCALGLLHSELRADFSRTRILPLDAASHGALRELVQALEAEAGHFRREERLEGVPLEIAYAADLRYVGQDFELQIPFEGAAAGDPAIIGRLRDAFHETHREHYGHAARDHTVELVAARLTVTGAAPELPATEHRRQDGDALSKDRLVWFEETGMVPTPVYARDCVPAGTELSGPAVIEQMDSVTIVLPGMRALVHGSGNLVLTWNRQ